MERNKIAQGKSSQVVSIGYQKENKLLEIEFSSGGVYQYSGVPESLYDAFIHSDSLGVFVANRIRGEFQYRRIHIDGLPHLSACGDENCFCAKLTKTSREDEPNAQKKASKKKLRQGI